MALGRRGARDFEARLAVNRVVQFRPRCETMAVMTGTPRSLARGVACALLAAVVACPLMVTVAATPAGSSCHDRPAEDHHGDSAAAFTCCATVVVAASLQTAHDADALLPAAAATERHPGQRNLPSGAVPRPRSMSPPLFLQHASLLI